MEFKKSKLISILKIKGYKDHQLKGKWRGYRALRLNKHYRVIYKIHKADNNNQFIKIERISKHDYSK